VHNAISHLKIVIVDGVYTVKGSTNWSLSGEQQQDNELTLSRNAVVAAETRAILDLNHDFMLKQMVGTKLDVTKLRTPATGEAMPPLPPAPGDTIGPESSQPEGNCRSSTRRPCGSRVRDVPGRWGLCASRTCRRADGPETVRLITHRGRVDVEVGVGCPFRGRCVYDGERLCLAGMGMPGLRPSRA
jgi:hypothetical protein